MIYSTSEDGSYTFYPFSIEDWDSDQHIVLAGHDQWHEKAKGLHGIDILLKKLYLNYLIARNTTIAPQIQ